MNSHYDALTSLYGHAKDHMTAAELREVGDALTDQAASLARRMDDVLQGIACLVSEDGKHKSGAGSFQDGESVFNLLCAMAQQFDTIAGMIEVGTEAKWKAGDVERQSA